MFVKMSFGDRLDCLVDFVGIILLCLLPPFRTFTAPFHLRLPSPNCFFRVCLATLFAAELKSFLPLITPPISGAANSIMSAPMCFAAGTTYLRKNCSSPNNLYKCPESPFPLSPKPSIVRNFYLS